MSSRAGANLRTLDERKELYAAVKELRAKGLSYNAIIAEIRKSKGVRLSKSHVSNWLTGAHEPSGSVTEFKPTPSFELGYVIGTTLGDGTTSISSDHNYAIKLQVTDKEFAEEFARCLGVVLNRRPPNVRWYAARQAWRTQVSSLLLQQFLRDPARVEKIIGQSREMKVGFLRGFFDSEGWVQEGCVHYCNGELWKMQLTLSLLRSLGLQCSEISVSRRAGGKVLIRGKMCTVNKDQFRIRIYEESRMAFRTIVGTSLKRKAERF